MSPIDVLFLFLILVMYVVIVGFIWKHIINFYHKRYHFFDFIFIIVYFAEQFIFLLLYNFFESYREFWISLIILIVLTTASLEKLLMYMRSSKASETIYKNMEEKSRLLNSLSQLNDRFERLHKSHHELIDLIEKKLKKKS